MSTLGKMMAICATAHADQKDKGGKPYFLHCMAVMNILGSDDEELNCIAVGHDLLEDCAGQGYDIAYLREKGFSDRIVYAIDALTKKPKQSYFEYKETVFSNYDSMRVKMADLTHNSDIRRLKGITEKDRARMAKYHEFYMELTYKIKNHQNNIKA